MEYKKGFNVKPYEVRLDGTVRFTDGTSTDLLANQLTCEAYGYTFDQVKGVCKAYEFTNQVTNQIEKKATSQFIGSKHETRDGTLDTFFSGKKNVTEGNNENCLLVGEENKIASDINNVAVFGKMGKPTHRGELCVGGGSFGSEAGLTQMSIVQLSAKTVDASDTTLYIDGDDDADTGQKQILLPANSVVTYEIWLSALVTGGSSGTAGDYEAYVWLGVIRTTNNGTMAHNHKIDRLLGRTGSLGTQDIDTSTAYTLSVQVTGLANHNIQYHAVAKLNINKTNAVEI